MGKKDLKKQYKELTIDLVDILSEIDTTPTKKITPFIVKQFYNERIITPDSHREELKSCADYQEFSPIKNQIDLYIKDYLHHWITGNLSLITEFTDHLENKRLTDLDINNYNSWNEMSVAVNEANLKYDEKSKKNRVIVLHDDSEWLIIKPLSLEASINYGYGAKWCTAMKNNSEYFHRYSKRGVLVYVINKTSENKYGFFSSPDEYSVWDKEDVRIDSLSTTIPFELLIKLRDWMDYEKVGVNYNYFEDEDKERINKLLKISSGDMGFDLDQETIHELRNVEITVGNGNGYVHYNDNYDNTIRLGSMEAVEFIPQPENTDYEIGDEIVFPEMTNGFLNELREHLQTNREQSETMDETRDVRG